MQGAFGYELDLSRLSEEDKEEVRKQVAVYREYGDIIRSGRYYRLTSPWENTDLTAWSYVAEDQSRAFLSVVFTDLHGNASPIHLRWKGLDPEAVYLVGGKEYTGTALMCGGSVIPQPTCNYDSCMMTAKKIR